MGKIREIMACELETGSLNQDESIFDSNGRVTPNKYLTPGESPVELDLSLDDTSCDSVAVHLSDADKSDIEGTAASLLGKVCSWDSLPSSLQTVFPDDTKYTYVIENYKEKKLETFLGAPQNAFEVQARVNVSSENAAKEWLSKLFVHSNCTYRYTRGANKAKGKRVVYKAFMHCQHQRKALTVKQTEQPRKTSLKRPLLKDSRKKKTLCPSILKLVVTNPTKKAMRIATIKPELVSHATTFTLLYNHNHPVNSSHALTFRPINSETEEVYFQLFSNGHSAASAWHAYETKLMIEGDDIVHQLADRAINPSPQDVSRLYDKWREMHLGPENGEDMFKALNEFVADYNIRHKEDGGHILVQPYCAKTGDDQEPSSENEADPPKRKKAKLQKDIPLSVAICTPLMARVHEAIPQDGEMMFVDSSSSMDRYNLSTFILSTSHCGGSLPLGVMITSNEAAPTIQGCLSQLQAILPNKAFYNNSTTGPKVIMTDDSESQRQALAAVWPDAQQLLCIFHVLQGFWTWLHEGKNRIAKEHRQVLMFKVKELVYAEYEEMLNSKYRVLTSDPTATLYPKFLQHVKNYWSRREKWAICFRKSLLIRGNHTNNYAEAGIKILKELVFARIKAFNLIEMISFVVDVMEMYYQRRLIHLANNRMDRFIGLRFCGMKSPSVPKESIKQGEDNLFYVNSRQERGLVYIVDMHLGTCTCKGGIGGAPCSHQAAVSVHFHINSINSIPSLFPDKRQQLAIIAVGNQTAPKDMAYYSSLHQKAEEEELANTMEISTADGM